MKNLINEKQQKIVDITTLQSGIQKKKSKIKKIEEELIIYKEYKKFLDLVAISAAKKEPKNL